MQIGSIGSTPPLPLRPQDDPSGPRPAPADSGDLLRSPGAGAPVEALAEPRVHPLPKNVGANDDAPRAFAFRFDESILDRVSELKVELKLAARARAVEGREHDDDHTRAENEVRRLVTRARFEVRARVRERDDLDDDDRRAVLEARLEFRRSSEEAISKVRAELEVRGDGAAIDELAGSFRSLFEGFFSTVGALVGGSARGGEGAGSASDSGSAEPVAVTPVATAPVEPAPVDAPVELPAPAAPDAAPAPADDSGSPLGVADVFRSFFEQIQSFFQDQLERFLAATAPRRADESDGDSAPALASGGDDRPAARVAARFDLSIASAGDGRYETEISASFRARYHLPEAPAGVDQLA